MTNGDRSDQHQSADVRGISGQGAVQPLFAPGQIVATPGALAALERANQRPAEFLSRHLAGDWGELDAHDIAENEHSLTHGFRLLSSYRTTTGETIWIITEAD